MFKSEKLTALIFILLYGACLLYKIPLLEYTGTEDLPALAVFGHNMALPGESLQEFFGFFRRLEERADALLPDKLQTAVEWLSEKLHAVFRR